MSASLMEAVMASRVAQGGELITLLSLAFHCRDGTCQCRPSLAALQGLTGLSRRALVYHLHHLEEVGLVAVERALGGTSIYTLLEPGTSAKSAPVQNLHQGKNSTSANSAPVQSLRSNSQVPVQNLHQGGANSAPNTLSLFNTSKEIENKGENKERESEGNTISTSAKSAPPPEQLEISAGMREWAQQYVASLCEIPGDLEEATEQWLDAMRAKGIERADWRAEWKTGMRQAVKYRQSHPAATRAITAGSGAVAGNGGTGGHAQSGAEQWAQRRGLQPKDPKSQAVVDVRAIASQASQRAEELRLKREGKQKR